MNPKCVNNSLRWVDSKIKAATRKYADDEKHYGIRAQKNSVKGCRCKRKWTCIRQLVCTVGLSLWGK